MIERDELDKLSIAASQKTKEKEYWLKQLSGKLVKNTFVYDYKDTGGDFKLDSLEFTFPGILSSRLVHLSKGVDSTLHMILAAGLAALLHKYTGSTDIIIGTPIYKQDTEDRLINMALALRIPLDSRTPFKEFLREVRQTVIRAAENQNYPIEVLLTQLNLSFAGNSFPLFDAALLLENIQDKMYLRHLPLNIIFSFLRTDRTLAGQVQYNALHYRKTSIERIVSHFRQLLESAVFNVDTPIRDIDMLPEKERIRLLVDFNQTREEFPKDNYNTVHQWFESQVDKIPHRIAVVYEDRCITYRELDKRANRLARVLKTRGIKNNSIAALLVEPSLEMIAGILGILKSGGSYFPIDPSYPEKRIFSLLKDNDIGLVLSTAEIFEKHSFTGLLQIEVRRMKPRAAPLEINKRPTMRPPHINRPGDLLYLISTSGSTGKPKSVMLEHRNLLNLLHFQFSHTPINFSQGILQFASICFDVSAQEIFSSLLSGGRLYLAGSERKHDIPALFDYIQENGMEVVFFPPSFLRLIFSEPAYISRFPTCIEHIISAGESLILNERLRGFLKENQVYLHNHYGPSETHVVTTYTIAPGEDIPLVPPIGKPISNTMISILDENMKLQPIGIPGELYIVGDSVGRGYYNHLELTRRRYLDSPFFKGQRMYRSGDLARWLPDGSIEYLGRIDRQVKIRGFRIELGEIESRILKYGHIKEAVVTAAVRKKNREQEPGETISRQGEDKYLCAYFTSQKEIEIPGLKEYLSNEMPHYMVPSYFIRLEKIPVTSNGKVDWGKLPAPDSRGTGIEYAAPSNEIEKQLMIIWREVLEVGNHRNDTPGIDDNFFELGGHSLKATILVSRLHETFKKKVPLAEIFNYPTVRTLSGYLKGMENGKYESLDAVEKKEYYALSSAQKRMYRLYARDMESIAYNMHTAIRIEGDLDIHRLEETFRKLIARHDSLRTLFFLPETGEEPLQRVRGEVEFKIESFLKTGSTGKRKQEIIKDLQARKLPTGFVRPFDLSRAPLLRVGLIKAGDKKYFIMVDMHHIIADAVTIEIFVRDLPELYRGELLPPLKLQYRDYSEWQRRQVQSEEMKKQESFWLREFSQKPRVLDLPTDYERPAIKNYSGSELIMPMAAEESSRLRKMALKEDVTLYMLMLSIYVILLWKLGGQEEIVVGTAVSGRRHTNLQSIFGVFINTLPLRFDIRREESFDSFLGKVRQKTLAALENQDYPFDKLVETLPGEKKFNRNPFFDVMFLLRDTDRLYSNVPGLKFKPCTYETTTSKLDLLLDIFDYDGCLNLKLEYSTELFKRETIQMFLTYYRKIAAAVIENGQVPLQDIEIIEERVKHQILGKIEKDEEEGLMIKFDI